MREEIADNQSTAIMKTHGGADGGRSQGEVNNPTTSSEARRVELRTKVEADRDEGVEGRVAKVELKTGTPEVDPCSRVEQTREEPRN